jgi:hypothetical protein
MGLGIFLSSASRGERPFQAEQRSKARRLGENDNVIVLPVDSVDENKNFSLDLSDPTHFRLVHSSRKAISNFRRARAPNFFFLK